MKTRDRFFMLKGKVKALFSEATPRGQEALINILHNCCCEFNPCTILKLAVGQNYANDAAAAVGGIAIGELYHTAGTVKIRLV